MKAIIQRIRTAAILAVLFAIGLASTAWATTDKTNPVTGQKESYANTFLGTNSLEWNAAGNWDTGSVPFVSGGAYTSALVDGKTVTSSADMDLWHGQIGAYSGASITIPGITKIQAAGGYKVFLTADRTSKITINAFRGKQLQGSASLPIELTSAQEGGITWNCGLTTTTDSSAPFHYYIDAINNGSVVYTGNITVANEQVIKQVNVKLTGTSQVSSKTLVTFGSGTTKAFTADAAIKIYGTDGTTLVETVNLAEVKTASTLKTSDPVGSCEIVQTSTGIVLYYVDGDPNAIVAKEYKPSININFCFGNAPLTTAADVGYSDYAVPGTSWNNMTSTSPSSGNGTFTTPLSNVYAVKTDGTKSLVSGASVALSGTPGSYKCNSLAAATDLRHGYIDENANNTAPTVTVSGIPYDKYKVVVYTSTDTANSAFGYVSVNGTDYTYVNNELAEGTAAWGASGADNSATAIAEGVNMLVTPAISGATATIVGHKSNGRGCIAAVQIVEYTPEIGENDLVIELDGDKTHTFEEAKTYDTVYVTGSGTLTFAGTASTATTLDISGSAAVNMNGSSLTPTAVTGTGTAIYTGVLPAEGLGWTASTWYGTVWIKNYTTKVASFQSNKYGNAASTLRLTGMNGYFDYKWTGTNANANYSQNVAIELVDDGDTPAFTYNDGWDKTVIYFAKLKGAGTLKTAGSGNKQTLYFANADEFSGTFDLAAQKIQIGGDEQANKDTTAGNGKLIVAGTSAMTANVKTANGGIYITGTLNGSIATANTMTISGTMNITGAATTEAIISVENGGVLNVANGGTLKLTRNTDDDGINPYAGVTIKSGATCTIASGGTITTDNSVTSTYYQFVVNGSMTVAGAFTTVADVAVNAGGSLTITGTMKAYWGIANSGTITLNGIDNVPAYASGYLTTITNSDTGVVKLTSTGSVDDSAKDYSTIKGTGTIEYCGSSWRSLPQTMFATTLSVVANQAEGVVTKHNNAVIGSLSGEKNLRSDLGNTGKTLTIKQAKDGVWRGIFKGGGDRLATIVIAPGDSTTGTLTLAGTQDQANWTDALTVDGSVNLTGTWQGPVTVSGTFGGTGTLTGALTFNTGSTFKAFASDTDGLAVSGTVTCPAQGKVTVDVSALEQTGTKVLMTASGLDDSKFALASGQSGKLSVDGNALKVSFSTYAASYGGKDYETIQEAIDAAVQAGGTYADVTILDPNATCPEEYYIDTENGNVLTKCQAALVDTEGGTHYFATLQAAVDEIGKYLGFAGAKIYDYYEVYYGENVAIAIDTATPAHSYWSSISLKIKCAVGASVAVTLASTEYELTEGDADANGIVTYTKTDKATTYVWAGATSDSATTSEKNYARAANWRVGTSSGATATRAPGSFDTVVFGNGAYASTTASQSVAALQVSGAVTILGGGSLTSSSAITLGTGDSITITGTLSPTPTTSVADSYVKETGDTTKTYTVDAYNTVTFAGDNYTLGSVMTNGAAVAVSEGSCKVEDGAITFTVAPNSGYAVTGVTVPSGEVTKSNGVYSYTVTEDATITVTTVSTSLTIGAATVEYLADYSMAKTVSATVTAGTVLEGTTWTLKTNGVAVADATGTYANGTVTFGNISVTLGDSITYSIEASNGSTGTSAESAASTVGRVTGGWIVEDSAHTGTGATGVWATPVTYTDGVATITDANTYTPNKTGDGIVTLETVVKFGNAADPEVAVGDGAQAAVKIANGKFAVYGKAASNDTADWQSTTVDADVDATYTVKLVINYNTGTFTISVKKNGTETATALGGTWYLATAATKVSSIAYKGTGAFTSLNGSFISGDVGVTVDETGVAVSSDFISKHLAGKTVDEAAAALNPDATDAASNPEAFAVGGNGINYFKCYALGLDPTKEEDKPIVDVTVVDGNYVFKVKHPVYNEQGEITGYVAINAADNVTTTVTLKYGTGAASLSGSASGAAVSPAEMFSQAGLNGSNVIYYKAEVSIGAK